MGVRLDGDRVKRRLRELGLHQKDVARKLDISAEWFSRVVSRNRPLDDGVFNKLCKMLRVEAGEIRSRPPDDSSPEAGLVRLFRGMDERRQDRLLTVAQWFYLDAQGSPGATEEPAPIDQRAREALAAGRKQPSRGRPAEGA